MACSASDPPIDACQSLSLKPKALVHGIRLAAAERADLAGLDLRLREPGGGDRARLADPGRGRSRGHRDRRGGDRRLGRAGRAHRARPLGRLRARRAAGARRRPSGVTMESERAFRRSARGTLGNLEESTRLGVRVDG